MAGKRGREAGLAARWAAGVWRGATLQAEDGQTFRVVFEGRRGGGAGPDFRDAVLARGDGTHLYGDIELHLLPAGWRAHGHASDPRYNRLALHVVLARGARDPGETPLANGRTAPLVVLGDAHPALPTLPELPELAPPLRSPWPCAQRPARDHHGALAELLHAAGMARFEGHVARLARELRAASTAGGSGGGDGGWDAPNRVLWLALAEALGYGRDRDALRRVGAALLDAPTAPLSLEHVALSGVERLRASGLLVWRTRWGAGPWAALETALRAESVRHAARAMTRALRVAERGAVSSGRAGIVAVNVVLPFAAALAMARDDAALDGQARAVYQAWPGLPSNQIVREMARTLGLSRLPRGALAQQGLHHLWDQRCREKRCDCCPCAVVYGQR